MSDFGFPLQPPSALYKTSVASAQEAQALASFPVRIPSPLPSDISLASFYHLWPPHIDAAGRQRKPFADWTMTTFVDANGRALQIIQGFIALFFEWTDLGPPADSTGTVEIGDVQGRWITANPTRGYFPKLVNGSHIIEKWVKNDDFAYVGWLDAVHPTPEGGEGDSPRYYGLASDKLNVDELAALARSVRQVSVP